MAFIKPPTQITGEILFYLTCVLCIIIIAPILIYFTFRFNQYKNTIVVRKRYPNIVIIILILLIVNICISVPLTMLVVTPTNLSITSQQSDFIILIESFLKIYLSHAVIILIALRFWMIFYKINYTYSSSTSAWTTVINPLISTNNWFLNPSNKATFGNAKSMFYRYFLPFYIVYGTIDFFLLSANRWNNLLFEFHLSYFQLIDALYYLLVIIFLVYLYKQTPNWQDHCFIRDEMRLGAILWFICLIIYAINSLIFLIFEIILTTEQTNSEKTTNEYIQSIITIYISLIFFTVYGLILTAYPTNKISVHPSALLRASSPDQIEMILSKKINHKHAFSAADNNNNNHNHNNHNNNTQLQTRRSRALSEPTHTNSIIKNVSQHSIDDEIIILNNNNNSNNNSFEYKESNAIINCAETNENDLNILLSDILSDAILFDRFMNYLSRSFSTESLLSFIEFYQFKQLIILQFQNELILNDNEKIFIQRLKIQLGSKKSIKKIRNGRLSQLSHLKMDISNLFNVILPDTIPKSYLIYGDFMVKQIMNGKSVRKSMGKLEKSASKFGLQLYQKEQKEQQKTRNNYTKKQLNQQNQTEKSKSSKSKSKSKSHKNKIEELSKTPSKVIQQTSELSKSDVSENEHEKSADQLHISPQNTITHTKTETFTQKLKKTTSQRSSIKPIKYIHNIRKESATVHSQTESGNITTFAGSYNSVRLQIPESAQYVREDESAINTKYNMHMGMHNIQTSMESVTEKDIYDDIKVGTPSMASQTIPAISGMDDLNIEESATQTYNIEHIQHKHLTGGVSVEVDEHLCKHPEISVTPQPSQTSVVTSITNLGYHNHPSTILARNLSHTNTHNYKNKTKRGVNVNKHEPITPYGSTRQRFGSATVTMSVTMDERDVQEINRKIIKGDKEASPSANSELHNKNNMNINDHENNNNNGDNNNLSTINRGNIGTPITPNSPNTPSINAVLRGIGFGEMAMDINDAKTKIRIIAHKLYMKYVNSGAEFEINIPHRIRKKYIKLRLGDLDSWLGIDIETQSSVSELYGLFDECMEEMFALMRSNITLFLDSFDYRTNN